MKKQWIILIVVLSLVAVGGLVAYLVSQGGKSEEEKLVEELLLPPEVQDMSSAPEIRCVGVEGELELNAQINREQWKRLNVLSLEVSVKNITNPGRTLSKAVLTKTIFNKSGAVIGYKNDQAADIPLLKPGEVKTINLDTISANPGSIGKIELSLHGVKFSESVSRPAAVPTPQATTEPAAKEQPSIGGVIYPRNPKSPGDVVAAFYGLVFDEKDAEAEKLLTPNCLANLKSEGGLGLLRRNVSEDHITGQLQRIQANEEDVKVMGDEAYVGSITFYFTDGTTDRFSCMIELLKVNGEWKIEE